MTQKVTNFPYPRLLGVNSSFVIFALYQRFYTYCTLKFQHDGVSSPPPPLFFYYNFFLFFSLNSSSCYFLLINASKHMIKFQHNGISFPFFFFFFKVDFDIFLLMLRNNKYPNWNFFFFFFFLIVFRDIFSISILLNTHWNSNTVEKAIFFFFFFLNSSWYLLLINASKLTIKFQHIGATFFFFFNQWSPDGSFMVQKMYKFPYPRFSGVNSSSWYFLPISTSIHAIEIPTNGTAFFLVVVLDIFSVSASKHNNSNTMIQFFFLR